MSDEQTEATTDDLDALLAQWEAADPGGTEEVETPEPDASGEDDAHEDDSREDEARRLEELERWREHEEQRQVQEADRGDMLQALEQIKEGLADLAARPSDEMVESFLAAEYLTNAAFQQAFHNRHADPDAWKDGVREAAKQYRRHLVETMDRAVSQAVNEDRNAVAAAMYATKEHRPQREDPMTADRLNQMSDREFHELARSMR